MTYNEQVLLEVIKGCFTVLAIGVGGGLVARTIEKFKSEQAVLADLRQRQYDSLGRMLAAIARHETAMDNLFFAKFASKKYPTDKSGDEVRAADEAVFAAQSEALATINAERFLLGYRITAHALAVHGFLVNIGDDDDWTKRHQQELAALKHPLITLLPPLPGTEKLTPPALDTAQPPGKPEADETREAAAPPRVA